MTNNERDSCGNFVNVAGGRPDLSSSFLRALDGKSALIVPHSMVKEAIEVLRESRAFNGAELVAALEYRMFEGKRKPNVETRTLQRHVKSACEHIETIVTRWMLDKTA